MQLFHKLCEHYQDSAVNYCATIIAGDIIHGNVDLEQFSVEFQAQIKKALTDIQNMDEEAKFKFVLETNEPLADVIWDMAVNMAHDSYYVDDGESVIHLADLFHPDEEHTHEHEDKDTGIKDLN